jgi:serine/threonine-protein kinase
MERAPTAARISGLEGQRLGPYQVVEMIGRGGMAVVYKALQVSLHRYVAIKVLPPYFVHEEGFLDRFQQEANTVARLQHPNILSVYDFSQEGDVPYIVMPLITGGTLRTWLRQRVPLTRALPVFNLILSALEYAHAQQVVHLDIKPNNILMHHGDWPLLTDFGIAKIVEQSSIGGPSLRVTQSSTISGTPQYMAPEQVEGGPIDRRADLYAMGIILFEMLTGRLLFEATSPMAIMLQHAQANIPSPRQFNPTLSPAWDEVIRRSLAKDPGERYASARIMAEAVQAAWTQAQQKSAAATQAPRAHAQHADRYAQGETTGQARAQTPPIVQMRPPSRTPPPETTLRLSALRPPPPEQDSWADIVETPRRSLGTRLALAAGLVALTLATVAGLWLFTVRDRASAQSSTEGSFPEAQKRCEQALALLADSGEALACKATALAAMATPTPLPTATLLPVAVIVTPTLAAPSPTRQPPATRPPATPTARPSASAPRPELTGRPPSDVRIGQPFEVEFQATNRGAAAERGSITISVTGAADIRVLNSTVKDGGGSYAKLFQPGEPMYEFKEGANRPVQNPLVEAYTNERWESGQTHRLRVQIVPHGPVSIQARATLREDTRFFHAPADGPTDQQGAPARSFRIVPSS